MTAIISRPARPTDCQDLSAIIGPEHAAPVGATPRAPVNQRIRSQARGAVADSVRRRGGASLNVNDDDLAVGGDQYRHACALSLD